MKGFVVSVSETSDALNISDALTVNGVLDGFL